MVKLATSLFVAAVLTSSAFASINVDEIDTRELSDYELFGRDLMAAEATLFTRDYDDFDDLFTRHPDELDAREFEDINRRMSVAAKIRNGFKKAFGFVKSVLFRREDGQEEVFAREYDEIDARDLDAIYQRYAEELEARGKALNGLKKVFGFVKKIFFREDGQEGIFAREYDEIDIRDLDALIDELEVRAPGVFQHILQDGMKHVKAIAHHGEKKKETSVADAAPEPEARDFDELSERDFGDDDPVERDLDLVERDFDEDVYEREYVDDLYARDFDLDLVERELYDLEERAFDDLD